MNRFQKKILTIAAGLANISLALSAASVATYAWFSVNSNATLHAISSDTDIGVEEPDDKIDYEILKYNDNIKAGEKVENFTLPDYDQYITERNVYANVIIRAEVTTSALDTSTNEFVVDVSRLASAFKNNGAIQSKTSNVIQFKAVIYSYKLSGSNSYTTNSASPTNIDETSYATKYATASAYFAAKDTPTTFVQIRDYSNDTSIVTRKTDADTITLAPSLPDNLPSEVTSCIIYLECSYHQKLVDEFIATNEAAETSHHSLTGDIDSIVFTHRAKSSNSSNATGRYVKIDSGSFAATGSYLPTYEYSSLQGKVLDGGLINSNYTETGTGTGANIKSNYKTTEINSSVGNINKSIDSSDDIDASAFAYTSGEGTFKSKSGYYLGHGGTNNNGIKSNSSSTGMGNNVYFNNGQAYVATENDANRRLKFNTSSSGDRFAYYTGSQAEIDLYRYSEYVAEIPTVSSISVNHTNAIKTFYTNHTFEITGLVVIATYSDNSTADVTSACSFTSNTEPTTLTPGTTILTTATGSKTITVTYNEGEFTDSGSYTISVTAEAISSITVSGTLTNQYYYVGDTFSYDGIVVTGHYNSGIPDVDLTSTVTYGGFSNMATAGTYTVTASYTGVSPINVGSITVVAKKVALSTNSLSIEVGDTDTTSLQVTYNVDVSIAQSSNNGGSITFSPSSISYSGVNKADQSRYISITGATAGTVTLTFTSGNISTSCTITVTHTPTDHFTITSDDVVSNSGYTSYTKTGFDIGNDRTANWVVTFGGNNKSIGTNSGSRSNCNLSSYTKYAVDPVTSSSTASAFASTTVLNKIKSISFQYTNAGKNPSSKVYAIYSANDTTYSQLTTATGSFAQGGTMNAEDTEYTFTFDKAYTGYFALVFVANNSSGDWRIDDLEVTFNPISLSSIALTGDLTTKTFQDGDSISDFTGLVVTATYGDTSTEVISNSNITWTVTPSTLTTSTTSVSIQASYTLNGTTKTANITVTGITVSAILVTSVTFATTTKTITVGDTFNPTATVLPANATNKTLSWTSSNTSVATVTNAGLITAVSAGSATITASSTDGSNKSATCSVTVANAIVKYSVTYTANGGTGNDYVVSNITSGSSHTLVSFATSGFTAPSGKQFKCWSVGGVEKNPGDSITVNSNVTVSAVWTNSTIELTFNLSSNPGGWPTTNSTTATNYTYTLDGVTYTFSLKNVKQNSGYLMLTSTAALGLPAISGKKLTKVVATNSGSCSTQTNVGISSSNSSASYINGGAIQTWSTTSSSYTYNLSGTSTNTMYYIYVTNKNAQIVSITLTYSA